MEFCIWNIYNRFINLIYKRGIIVSSSHYWMHILFFFKITINLCTISWTKIWQHLLCFLVDLCVRDGLHVRATMYGYVKGGFEVRLVETREDVTQTRRLEEGDHEIARNRSEIKMWRVPLDVSGLCILLRLIYTLVEQTLPYKVYSLTPKILGTFITASGIENISSHTHIILVCNMNNFQRAWTPFFDFDIIFQRKVSITWSF